MSTVNIKTEHYTIKGAQDRWPARKRKKENNILTCIGTFCAGLTLELMGPDNLISLKFFLTNECLGLSKHFRD